MSLRDEIQKLIDAEQAKLRGVDQANSTVLRGRVGRFRALRAVLEDIVASVEPQFLQAQLSAESATLSIGRTEESRFQTKREFRIEPSVSVDFNGPSKPTLQEETGFTVEETEYIEYPHSDLAEEEHHFATEKEVASFLIEAIAKEIAEAKHLEELKKRIAEEK